MKEKYSKEIQLHRVQSKYAIEIKDLVVQYKTEQSVVHAVNSISLDVKKKTVMGIVGETGAGKTTAMLALMRLIPSPPGDVKSGKILVNGLDIGVLSPKELCEVRGKEIAMIFQDPMTSLNPVMPIGYQIAESIKLHEKVTKSESLEKAKKMLEIVGIDPNRYNEYPHQFSGGMRQRVGIAIALGCKPSVLIADEPTTALDVTIQAQVLNLMRELKDDYDTSMILITHDLGVVAEMCDEVAVMYAGCIVEKGTLEEIFNDTRHPYTEGLFNSLPNINKKVDRLISIDGQLPDPSKEIIGCAFAERCPYAKDRCFKEIPQNIMFSETHIAICSAYEDPNFHIKRNAKNG